MIYADDLLDSSIGLKKAPTGIIGLDQITRGGFPAGRPTLICGGPGCGKTILAMEFLVRGARQYDEPGLFVSFEETESHLVEDFESLGFDLKGLVEQKKLKIVHIGISKDEIVESGSFTLDGLLILLEHGIKQIGAKRLVLDTLEAVFTALGNTENLRTEIGRLFQWLKDKGVTAVITGERGAGEFTGLGFEAYISDCVILLDHRTVDQTSKRRLRVVKYRGSGHAADEFPFLIAENGMSVVPITSLILNHGAGIERVGTGLPDLDNMLEGKGYFQGSTVLITGKAGTGKSTLGAAFAAGACARGERCLYFAFEESVGQITRNLKSVGIDFNKWLDNGSLKVRAFRPSFRGLEEHLVSVARETLNFKPTSVVMDPITNFVHAGGIEEVKSMLTRILDLLKQQNITLLMTALVKGSGKATETELHLSSMVDTWIALDLALEGQSRRRDIYVVKARGMAHSQSVGELIMAPGGLTIDAHLPEVAI
jgi:circadian clock protein KaiC